MGTPHFQDVIGEVALSASLAASGSGLVQIDTVKGGGAAISGTYYTGFQDHGGPLVSTMSVAFPDNRAFPIFWSS